VTHDISHLTCADLFRAPGVQTPVIARFSTVIHERGSPETIRDPRGFAVKFYTREGNWDLVGNNMPVFFIRDGMKFPDMVHALKPNPVNHIQEGWRIADFFSHVPECEFLIGRETGWRAGEKWGWRRGGRGGGSPRPRARVPALSTSHGTCLSLLPSSHTAMHMFTFLLDDVGIPLNYRHMEGFGVHTFTLLTRDGKVRE